MHNNYYLLRQLAPELNQQLAGATLTDCFSQHKDELIVQFSCPGHRLVNFIAHLTNQFTCLAFPTEIRKARKNTATVFPGLQEAVVESVAGFTNERALAIHFTGKQTLLFKLFGRQANVLLLMDGEVTELFKNNLSKDFNLNIHSLARPLDQSKAAVLGDLATLKNVYPTLDKPTRNDILAKINGLEPEAAYTAIKRVISQLANPGQYAVINRDGLPALTLLPATAPIATFHSPMAALTFFFKHYLRAGNYQQIKQGLLKDFTAKANKTSGYLYKTREKVEALRHHAGYQQKADLLMANLHTVPANARSVTLADFYTGEAVSIKLNPRLNAQQNAERYYRKAKNVAREIARLDEAIAAKEKSLAKLTQDIEKLTQATSLDDLKPFIKLKNPVQQESALPYKEFLIDGFRVLVGKNARQNDVLTLKFAKKDDLFFHARDVAGSHVILKRQSGTNFPAATLEKVASLAAWYSKRKTDSLCPVAYTARKYVRKPKGAAPGLVLVEREKVLLVKPELPA